MIRILIKIFQDKREFVFEFFFESIQIFRHRHNQGKKISNSRFFTSYNYYELLQTILMRLKDLTFSNYTQHEKRLSRTLTLHSLITNDGIQI